MKLKKVLFSSFVVLAVVAYAVYLRFAGDRSALNPNSDSSSTLPTTTQTQQAFYKDGEYTGKDTDTIFGKVQVAAVISGGKLVDVKFLHFPNDRTTSINISNTSLPLLKNEAIIAQSANVDIVSGATQTSEGFSQSLAAALALAK